MKNGQYNQEIIFVQKLAATLSRTAWVLPTGYKLIIKVT